MKKSVALCSVVACFASCSRPSSPKVQNDAARLPQAITPRGVAGRETEAALAARQKLQAAKERAAQQAAGTNSVASEKTRSVVEAALAAEAGDASETAATPVFSAKGRFGMLYFTDSPAHRARVLRWLEDRKARITFQDDALGYIETTLAWKDIAKLVDTAGDLGLSDTSFFKLEVEDVKSVLKKPDALVPGGVPSEGDNSSWMGPVHSAGYGAKVDEFRAQAARDLGLSPRDLEGQGTTVAVFDGGIDASRIDVFGNRLVDFIVGDDHDWKKPTLTLEQVRSKKLARFEAGAAMPAGLEDLEGDTTLRFVTLKEEQHGADLNASGAADETLVVAVSLKGGEPTARFAPSRDLPFGTAVGDYGKAAKHGKARLIDLSSGEALVRTSTRRPKNAVGVKFQGEGKETRVAFVGMAHGAANHGIANLHMAGGDYVDSTGTTRFRGTAPATRFLAVQPWRAEQTEYGTRWLPFARSIVLATRAGADVLDLDVYTPGARRENGLLSELLCRITSSTDAVPVVAAHNFGANPDTVQSLAQSPCVLGIGAAHSRASQHARNRGSSDPALRTDDAVMTAEYSGRGFGLNGQFKPDILSPAYGLTAYGEHFIRFAGTSGATPATAGMIALLKQAAAHKDTSLNFDQVKSLLQGASTPVRPGNERDGYGYTDLASAWKLFLERRQMPDGLSPVRMNGQVLMRYLGRPNVGTLTVPVTRQAVKGSIDGVVPMRFWVEYGGASVGLEGANWMKFYDPSSGTLSTTLAKDIPMHGETQNIRLAIDLPDSVWNALPAGDHIAVVKGVRADRYDMKGSREVDFLQPVTFVKAIDTTDTKLELPALYMDSVHTFPIATLPGEVLLVSAEMRCEGTLVARPGVGSTVEGIDAYVDNDFDVSHAANVMNGYAPVTVGQTPLRIVARKEVVNITLARASQDNCDGAKLGTLHVRRLGFSQGQSSLTLTRAEGKQTHSIRVPVTLRGAPLSEGEFQRNALWRWNTQDAQLVLSRVSDDSRVSFIVPAGLKKLRVRALNSARQQGVVHVFDAKGKEKSVSLSNSADASGFGAWQGEFAGAWQGLAASELQEGDTVVVNLATKAKWALELYYGNSGLNVTPDASDAYTAWKTGETKTVACRVGFEPANVVLPSVFKATEFTADARLVLGLDETQANTNDDVAPLPVRIFEGTAIVPFTLE